MAYALGTLGIINSSANACGICMGWTDASLRRQGGIVLVLGVLRGWCLSAVTWKQGF